MIKKIFDKGFVIIVVLFILLILSSIIIAYLKSASISYKTTQNSDAFSKAKYLSLSGLEYTKYLLNKNLINGDTEIIKYIYTLSSDTYGYFKIKINSDTLIIIGSYKNYFDTIVSNIDYISLNPHYILLADSGINLFDTGSIHNGLIHSNSFINTSSIIVNDSVNISAVANGAAKVSMPIVYFDSMLTFINTYGKVYSGDTAFIDSGSYTGLYYIRGNATIGGPLWWDQNWNYRRGIVFRKPLGYAALDYSQHHYYININFLTDFPVPIDNIDLNSIRLLRNNTLTYKGDLLPYQIISSANNNGVNGIDFIQLLVVIHPDDLNNASETEVVYYLYFDTLDNGAKTAIAFNDQIEVDGGPRITTYDIFNNQIYRARFDNNGGWLNQIRNFLGTDNGDLLLALILDYNPWREDYNTAGAATNVILDGNLLSIVTTTKTINQGGRIININRTYYFYPRYFIVNLSFRQTAGGLIQFPTLRFFHTNRFNNSWIVDSTGANAFIDGNGNEEGLRRNVNINWYSIFRNSNAYSMCILSASPANNWLEYYDNAPSPPLDHYGAVGAGYENINLGTTYNMSYAYKFHPGQIDFNFTLSDYNIFTNNLLISYKPDGGTNILGTVVADSIIRISGTNKNNIISLYDTMPVLLSKNRISGNINSATNLDVISGLVYSKRRFSYESLFLTGSIISDSMISTQKNINLNFFNNSLYWDSNAINFIDLKFINKTLQQSIKYIREGY